MRYSVVLEADGPFDRGGILIFARGLGELVAPPETLVWSILPGEVQLRVWMVVDADSGRLGRMSDILREIPGFRKLALGNPDEWLPRFPALPGHLDRRRAGLPLAIDKKSRAWGAA